MAQSIGVDNLVKLISGVAITATAAASVLEDRKVDFSDLKHLPSLVGGLVGFLDVDFEEVLPELKDLTGEETDLLAKAFEDHFSLSADSKEEVIEQGFEILLDAVSALQSLRDIAKRFV